jgi:hypothetical protein
LPAELGEYFRNDIGRLWPKRRRHRRHISSAEVPPGGRLGDRIPTRSLKCPIKKRVDRAVIPSLEVAIDERTAMARQHQAMSKIDEFLEGQVRERNPRCVR